jgi:hypothetical protein
MIKPVAGQIIIGHPKDVNRKNEIYYLFILKVHPGDSVTDERYDLWNLSNNVTYPSAAFNNRTWDFRIHS